ncbi:MAG: HAMP domain-containing protein [Nitrospirae bacterium]|nr:HAMP domain-containing protein [Nitrospirota bacterium]
MLKNMKVGLRLGLGFSLVVLFFVTSMFVTTLYLRAADNSAKRVADESVPYAMTAGEMAFNIVQVQQFLTDVSATHNKDGYKDAEEAAKGFKSGLAKFKDMFTRENDTKGLKEMDELDADFNKYYEVGKHMADVYVNKGIDAGNVIMEDFDKVSKTLADKMAEVKKGQITEANTSSHGIVSAINKIQIIQYALGGIAIVLAIVIALFLTRSITLPLSEGVTVMNQLAEGDLRVNIEVKSRDELGQLLAAMKNMVDKLTSIVTDVKSASDNVASGSQQLSSGAQQISQGATEQASSIEETSSSMEEMTSNIKQNSDNAHQTEKIAQKSAIDAVEGGKAVTETVGAMKEIAGKITIIEEIARQTNLLALNAAIEAARAGEHGKGFAVVASEVRKLAERSQNAAGEISHLSTNSVQVAEKAGEMLAKLVPDIQKTAELVQEISAASREQDTGAGQINQAIQQFDKVIQQNAGAAEELASTSEELASQADLLQTSISFFKTGESGAAGTIARVLRKPEHRVAVAHIGHEIKKVEGTKAAKAIAGSSEGRRALALDMDEGGKGHEGDNEFEKY